MALVGEGDLLDKLLAALRPAGFVLTYPEGREPGGETDRYLFTRHSGDGSYVTFRWTGKWSPRTLAERGLVEIGGERIHRTDESCVFECAFERRDGSVMSLQVREYFDERLTVEHLRARAAVQVEALGRTKALALAAEAA